MSSSNGFCRRSRIFFVGQSCERRSFFRSGIRDALPCEARRLQNPVLTSFASPHARSGPNLASDAHALIVKLGPSASGEWPAGNSIGAVNRLCEIPAA
jgi:hypothetical protein